MSWLVPLYLVVVGRKLVTSLLAKIRSFLMAEEVPRWFGLSLVLIYLIGLGQVSRFGIVQARRESAGYYERSSRYAVNALADRLIGLGPLGSTGDGTEIAYRVVLREFASELPTQICRVLRADGLVVASIDPGEVGTTVTPIEIPTSTNREIGIGRVTAEGTIGAVRVFRARLAARNVLPVTPALADLSGDAENPPPDGASVLTVAASALDLEVQLPVNLEGTSSLAGQASVFMTIFVALGALFVFYRCLREQLRGVSRISERLRLHKDRIESDLAALRIADTPGSDVAAWNELIDLASKSLSTVHHAEADAELSRVLQASGGGALAEAFNAVPDGLIYVTDEVRFEYANSAACRLFGWNPTDLKEMTLPDATSQGVGARVLELLRAAQQPDGSFAPRAEMIVDDGEGEDRGKTGDASTHRLWIIPVNRGKRDGECVVVIRDVSQQVRTDRAREELITQVTHELRTPLTNIRAYAETLASGMFDDPKVITECYNVITKETRRLSRLIEDVLSVSQLEVGGIELQLDQVDLRSLLGDSVADVRGLTDEKNIDLQVVLPAKLEPIRADRDKLAVILNNLLGNAIKYTKPEGNVIVGCQITGNSVVITVKDNGIGIAPAEQSKVFEKFYRVGDPEAGGEQGTGIGLYTAREIARQHGGDIELISEKGSGSTFIVRLPHQETRATKIGTEVSIED